jgi:hypothetical protein
MPPKHPPDKNAPQPTPAPALTDGQTAGSSEATLVPPPGAKPGSIADRIDKAFQPLATAFGGKGAESSQILGDNFAEMGSIQWELKGSSHGYIGTYKTLGDAQQAAIQHVHTRQPSVLASRKNPSTWTITPVLVITVLDVCLQPVPVGSLAKVIDDGKER